MAKLEDENPSQLGDESRDARNWSKFTIRCAEKYYQCCTVGMLSSLCIYVLATIVAGILVKVWFVSSSGYPYLWGMLFGWLLALAFSVPISKMNVSHSKRRKSVKEFVEKREKERRNPFNHPLALTLVLLFAFSVAILALACFLDLPEFDLQELAIQSRVLLATPLVAPLVYVVLNATTRRAGYWLDLMASKS